MKTAVFAKLPRAGLGNKLLVWARAYAFACRHNLPLYTFNWTTLHLGPWLRREKHKRYYRTYFKDPEGANRNRFLWARLAGKLIPEPDMETPVDAVQKQVFVFSRVLYWQHAFDGLKPYREQIRQYMGKHLVADSILMQLANAPTPVVAVHIRMGDFRRIPEGESMQGNHNARTPLSYFSQMIHAIRSVAGSDLPVTLFSDGYDDELKEILQIPDVQRATPMSDIAELLLMSRSKVIVPSASSTFSLWAGFLSDAILFQHPDHYLRSIRPEASNEKHWEGAVGTDPAQWPEQLTRQLRSISPGTA
ncbi:MAG: alpha-1,2-fucosyltransferase [Flavobacteriales bacterium]|nr:alpha-1,2-fucosyltransferase [Flavobacteriales bacterium]MCB9447571.1 alpha-1,2-fucosyltransferase [Flavobacteriales bacterium]